MYPLHPVIRRLFLTKMRNDAVADHLAEVTMEGADPFGLLRRSELQASSAEARGYFWALHDGLPEMRRLLEGEPNAPLVRAWRYVAACQGLRSDSADARRKVDTIKRLFQKNGWHSPNGTLPELLDEIERIGKGYEAER